MAAGWVRPSMVECATRSSWSRTAASIARVAVAVHVAPQRGDAVDVAPALGVDQVGALGALDDHRLLVGPSALLGERMPEAVAVAGHQLGVGGRTVAHGKRP